jgi:hypothetical protein
MVIFWFSTLSLLRIDRGYTEGIQTVYSLSAGVLQGWCSGEPAVICR